MNDTQQEPLDCPGRSLIERRGRLVQQECHRSIRQGACERYTLRLAPRQVADISLVVSGQADTLKQRSNLLGREPFTSLLRSESYVRGHRPGEKYALCMTIPTRRLNS